MAKVSKQGKTGQSAFYPQVEDPEEHMNARMMHGKKKPVSKPKGGRK